MIDLNINSITELSKQSGVSKPKIHQYLNGKSPLATTYLRLCGFLELNPDDTLIFVDEDGRNNENEKIYFSARYKMEWK